ncbi:heavy-metal-associated domain-containing protein [Curtobacterium sp. MCBA15_013]|uniref:heavy-metal-associated domain-containing protein n=1 Tax=Curtobacterium sp. MCBA15_013 TaxID=1898739 RepID=UPI0008DE9242|nr:cation transporter [Curtobacterium sp. MCBA15_013]OII24305.1 heavy metal transporter [Curtobacterium sp. MCBA15_013]
MNTELLLVEGMTCDHCVMSVTEDLTELDGVSDVRVRLVPGGASEVTVTSDAPVASDALRAAVTEAGYEVVRS